MSTTQLNTAAGSFRIDLQGPDGAPVLVFSNSLGTTLDMWAQQAQALRERYRVLRYDTRGHGGSVCSPGPYRFAQLGRDVLAILDALEISHAHFCGISMGGLTGLWLGVHAGARLRSIAVCNSAARIGDAPAWLARAAMVREQGPQGMRALADSAPARWFTEAFLATQPAVVRQAQDWIASIAPEGYASCCEALASEDLRAAIAGIATPTLLVAGTHDPVTTVADAEAMQAAITGAELACVPASHLSNLEAPAAFLAALSGFLDRQPQVA
ncbi:3-oxoadipate enol-lactonase [Corticibacter populi]|uniref:3-oxoadipate enol-lactonase n=1 Tax=Corticibacter populi TaxID=1550736 RepID=A0A3M6QS73_9BURK|nr:3-oxoadipate enol-lactonase [Corticibacter populi]RMX05876.1 3-oxoadipate enol-lactonase [Corticibacter populi]RZS30806.1 3-oxoadipate enol-lactonase [Corticibacter populi]